jgi:tetratricopeptide (TPR) repeat protein
MRIADSIARNTKTLILNHIGLIDEGLREAQAADAINPSAKRPLFQIGYALLWQGKYKQALPVLLGIPKEFNPGSAGSFIAWALFQLGRREEAQIKLHEYFQEYPQDTGGRFAAVQALLFAAAGEEDKALHKIQSATRKKDFGHFHHTAHFIASASAR